MVPLKPRKGGKLVISSYKEVPGKEGRKKNNKEKIMFCWLGWQAGGLTQRLFSFFTLFSLQAVHRRGLNVKISAKKAGNLAMVNADESMDQTILAGEMGTMQWSMQTKAWIRLLAGERGTMQWSMQTKSQKHGSDFKPAKWEPCNGQCRQKYESDY
jgi:hypothetical protein